MAEHSAAHTPRTRLGRRQGRVGGMRGLMKAKPHSSVKKRAEMRVMVGAG